MNLKKAPKWKQHCEDIIKPSPADENPLISALIEIKNTLERYFEVYINSEHGEARNLCICCSSAIEDHDLLTCSTCKDRELMHGEFSLETCISMCRELEGSILKWIRLLIFSLMPMISVCGTGNEHSFRRLLQTELRDMGLQGPRRS